MLGKFDSLRANSKVSEADAQRTFEVPLKMLERWECARHSGDIWRCTGNRPNYWSSSILNSLTAGSNCMIPT
jgi:hypothetical protein